MGTVFGTIYLSLEMDVSIMRVKVILTCETCLSRNYSTMKNKQTDSERMVIKKFCRRCNTHTIHKETK